MKIQSILIYVIVICINNSCVDNATFDMKRLIGKWKVTEPNNEYIIQIEEDSTLRMYNYHNNSSLEFRIISVGEDFLIWKEKPRLKANSNELMIEPQKMFFELIDQTLIFKSAKTNKVVTAINCNTGICDEAKDFFRNQPLAINLPLLLEKKDSLESFIEDPEDLIIFMGRPKESFKPLYGESIRYWIGDSFADEIIFPTKIQKGRNQLKDPSKELRIVCFIDKKIPMNDVNYFFDKLFKSKISNIYLAVLADANTSLSFQPKLRKIQFSNVNYEDTKETFKEWIN